MSSLNVYLTVHNFMKMCVIVCAVFSEFFVVRFDNSVVISEKVMKLLKYIGAVLNNVFEDLVNDLSSELSFRFKQTILALMMTPCDYDASEMNRAIKVVYCSN